MLRMSLLQIPSRGVMRFKVLNLYEILELFDCFFTLLRFWPAGYHPSPLDEPLDSGAFYNILNLADVADVFIANSISRSDAF